MPSSSQTVQFHIDPNSNQTDQIKLTDELVATYRLEPWATQFTLMTAGYRDHIDPDNADSSEVWFNSLTVAIMAEAKARVFGAQLAADEVADVHIGGDTRYLTDTFIAIAARVYAAHGQRVHLRKNGLTTPIWYSSFGIVYNGYHSGDNFTSSHSPYFKHGWKAMDNEGKQVVEHEAAIISEVQKIVQNRDTITLAPRNSTNIEADFDVDEAYAAYQRSVLGDDVLETIKTAARADFKVSATTVGGSMGATTRQILSRLNIPKDSINFFLDNEDPRFHRVGEIGRENLGADVGKVEVCRNTGAPAKVLSNQADIVLFWDPDGDRFNILSATPKGLAEQAAGFGLTVEPGDAERSLVYFRPNQLALLLTHYRIQLLQKAELLDKHDWFVVTTFPSALAIEELAAAEGVKTIRVPVGFKFLGGMSQTIEKNLGHEQTITTLTGQKIGLGVSPRALIMCEESGGSNFGGAELLRSQSGMELLALREKDGLQMALLLWALAAELHQQGKSLAELYLELIQLPSIKFKYEKRLDVTLYDEGLMGEALSQARAVGIAQRDQAVAFFKQLVDEFNSGGSTLAQIQTKLQAINPDVALPEVTNAAWIGDGSMFEMEDARLVIRASGTDALFRYYTEATSKEKLEIIMDFVSNIKF